MTQSLRQIKRRIKSVENTGKLTRAMEMISISKLRPLQEKLPYGRDYFTAAERILNNFLGDFRPQDHPLMEERRDKRSTTLCLFTSDTGLCGSYNVDIIRLAKDFMTKRGAGTVNLVAVGKKGFTY